MNVSVVICAHDEGRWAHIERALESVRAQSRPPAQLVLVVDHNPPLLARARAAFPDVAVVENAGARGLGEARNTGVSASTGGVVAFLDDDAVASRDWLRLLVEQYDDPLVAGAGGSSRPSWEGTRPAWFPPEFDWVVGSSYRGMPEDVTDVRNLLGCNMSLRRDVLLRMGGFRLGYGCDETHLCIALRQRWPELRLVYVPEARIEHHVPSSRGRLGYFLSRCYFEGGSKAVVSKLVGADDGLASEVRYTREILPRGVKEGVAAGVHGEPGGLGRAGAIVAGLAATASGYAAGRLTPVRAARRRGWQGERLERYRPALDSARGGSAA